MKTYSVYLNGDLTITEKTYEVTNPAKGEAFARMSQVERAVVAQAIQHAHAGFQMWRNLPGKKRGELLRQVATEVHRRRDEIARVITLENGKPLAQSEGEVAMTVDHLTWFGEEARRGYGRLVPHQAVEGTMLATFPNTGQSCISANRIYVQRPIYESFLKRFVEKARALKV